MDFVGFEEDDDVRDRSRKPRKRGRQEINRKTKFNLVFDPEARRRFLTGFTKRKLERKAHYQEKLEKELVEEKSRMRVEAKKSIAKKQSSSHAILPEVEHLLDEGDTSSEEEPEEPTETFEFGRTTVSISSLDDSIHPAMVKLIKDEDSSEDEDNPEKDKDTFMRFPSRSRLANGNIEPVPDVKKLNKKKLYAAAAAAKSESLVKKEANRLLMQTDIYKKTLRIKQHKSRKFKQNKLLPGSRKGKGSSRVKAAEAAAAGPPAVRSGKKKASKGKSNK